MMVFDIFRPKSRLALNSSVAIAALLLPASLSAQAIQPTESDASEATPPPAFDEIVVTANRRSQSANSVGASIASMSGDNLVQRGIASASDLAKVVPGFTAADTGLNVPVYSLRGVGFNDPSLAANSTVAIAVDEVPLPYTAMTQGAILDLQRLEVLKGPQGTLYGQNATGGAINYIANKPTDSLAWGGQLTYGRFNTVNGEAYVSGPLSETVKVRLAASGTRADDWQKSATRNDSLGRARKVAGRFLANWEPSETLHFDLSVNGWYDGSDTQAAQLVGLRAQSPANVGRLPQVFSYPLTPQNARAADWAPNRDYSRDDRFYQISLKAGLDLTDDIQLASITAYSHFKTHGYTDRDGMTPDNFNVETNGKITSIYEELRLNGNTGGLTWSVGGNYRRDRVRDQQLTDIGEATNSFAAGVHFDIADVRARQKVETYAFFADGEYEISPQFSIVGGVRYTKDKRDFTGCSADNGAGDTSALYTILSRTFRTARGLPVLAPLAPGQCATLSANTFVSGPVNDSLNEDNVSFRTGLNFKPAAGSLIYASFARGYKAGTFPTLGAAFAIGYEPVKQERLDAIELGFKTTLIDRRAHLNAAIFNYDYANKQLRGRIIDPVVGSLSKLVNIPKSNIKGAEVEITVNPTDGLTFYSAVSYLRTRIKEFVGINLFSVSQNFAGATLNYAPPWSVNTGGEYRWSLNDRLKAFTGADLTHRSRTSGFLGRDRDLDIKGYVTLDLRAGIESEDGRWSASIWGNNVTNEYYWTSTNRGSDTINRITARPATYGVTLKFAY